MSASSTKAPGRADLDGGATRGNRNPSKTHSSTPVAGTAALALYEPGGEKLVLTRDRRGLADAFTHNNIDVRWNLRTVAAEYRTPFHGWTRFDDRRASFMVQAIAEQFDMPAGKGGKERRPLKFGRESWEECLNAILYAHEVDPFAQWLDRLPEWDSTFRLDNWLSKVFAVDEACPLVQWAGRFLVLGCVWRTRKPGVKLDETPVLIGPQGCGKSTALRWLLPQTDEGSDWFADGLDLAADDKRRVEALDGRVVVEIAEMAGRARADLESLKAFMTRTDDGYVRRAYARHAEAAPRRCILVGTANPDGGGALPNDTTGLRRFVPVEVGAGPAGAAGVREYLDEHREQLWAEAINQYECRMQAWLPEKLADAQTDATERHRRRDTILEDVLLRWIEIAPPEFTLAQAAVGCGLVDDEDGAVKLARRDQARLGAALTANGYRKSRQRVNGALRYVWSI